MNTRAAWHRLRAHLDGRGQWWWVPLVYVVALAFIYRDQFSQHGHPTAFGWDTTVSYGPNLEYLGRDLADGRWSWWNPYDKGGYAVVGDPECDRYHPIGLLFIGVSALLDGPWWLIHVKVLTYHLLAACLLHLYLRTRGVGNGASLLAGLTLVASAPLLIHDASAVIWPLVFVPLGLIAVDNLIAKPTLRSGTLLAGGAGMIITAGSPPGVFYAALILLAYAVFRLVGAARAAIAGGVIKSWLREFAPPLAVTVVVALLIALVVVVPFSDAVELSTRVRATGGGFALDGAQQPSQILPALLAPTAGKLESYFGGVALAIALCGLVANPGRDGRVSIFWIVMATLGMVLMFGRATPILPALVEHVPGFGRLRVPGRYKLMSAWAIAPLVGFAAASLTRDVVRRRRVLVMAGVLVVIAVLCIAMVPQINMPGHPRGKGWGIVPILVGAGGVIAFLYLPQRFRAGVFVALALATTVDAPSFVRTSKSLPPAYPIRPHDDEVAKLAQLTDVNVNYRVFDEFLFADRVGMRRGIRDFRGYPSVDQLSQFRYVEVLKFAKKDPAILADFGVRYLLHAPHYQNGKQSNFVTKPPTEAQGFMRNGQLGFVALHPAPLVAWYGAAKVVPSANVLAEMRAAQLADGTRTYVVVDDDRVANAVSSLTEVAPLPSVAGTVSDYQPDVIAVTVDAPADGVVVLNELWDPGWTVTVDGRNAPLLRVNQLMRGVAVGPGVHKIVWRFEPRFMRTLLAGVALGWLLVLAALLIPRRRVELT